MFFRKKKKEQTPVPAAIDQSLEIKKTLRDTLAAAPRVEGKEVGIGILKKDAYPSAFVKVLGPTLKEDLGDAGRVIFYYNTAKEELTLLLSFCYGQDSAEMEVIQDCLDTFDLEDENPLPGDVRRLHTTYIENADLTEINFISEGVTHKNLKEAADRLVSFVFDWLDIVYEAFEEEF